MLHLESYYDFRRRLIVSIAICLLSACSQDIEKPAPSAKPAVQAQYTASDYISHLALVKLTPKDLNNLEIINAYANQKSKLVTQQSVVVLEYQQADTPSKQQLVAPVALDKENNNFPELLSIMQKLGEQPYTLHNLQVTTVSLKPGKHLKLSQKDVINPANPHNLQINLLKNTIKFSPEERISAELRLITFFIKHRFRDAAYLAVDNAKQSLASLQRDMPDDAQTITSLSQELDQLESEVHKTMPFTLSLQNQ